MELFKEEFANEQVLLPEIKRPCAVYKNLLLSPSILIFPIAAKKILLINVPNVNGSTVTSNVIK